MISLIKKLISCKLFKKIQPLYHYIIAALAAAWYRYPSRHMFIIGVTGTTGKTSSVYFMIKFFKKEKTRLLLFFILIFFSIYLGSILVTPDNKLATITVRRINKSQKTDIEKSFISNNKFKLPSKGDLIKQ